MPGFFEQLDPTNGGPSDAIVPVSQGDPGTRNRIEAYLEPADSEVAAAAPPASRRLSLDLLLRFKWLAIAVFLLIAVPGATAVWLLVKPAYAARATVEVAPKIPRIVYRTDENGQIPLYQQYLNSQASALRSPTVLNRALERKEVQATAWYNEKPAFGLRSPVSPLERLRDKLEVGVRGRTSYIDVGIELPDAKESALIVNAVVEEYKKWVDASASEIDDSVFKTLNAEFNALKTKIDGTRATIALLRGDLLTATPEDLLAQQRARLDQKVAAVESLRTEIDLVQWQMEQLEELAPTSQPAAAELSGPQKPAYELDSEWRRLYLDVKTAEHRVELESQKLGDAHPRMVELRTAVTQAQENLGVREQQLDDAWSADPQTKPAVAGAAGSIKSELGELAFRLKKMQHEFQIRNKDLDEERNRVKATAGTAQRLEAELNVLHEAEARFKDVSDRKVAMEIESRAPGSIQIRDKAFAPSRPSNSTRRTMLILVCIVAGLGCGLVSAYLRATTTPAVQQVSDLAGGGRIPLLGHVPLLPSGRKNDSHGEALQSECIRMIRTALLQRVDGGQGCVIQITSAGPGAGKTTVAVMLAKSLARCGKSVLLVDADLRNPRVYERCGLAITPGLVDVLSNSATDKDAVVTNGEKGVFVLPSGRLGPDHDSELLANGVLADCLRRWRAQYDVVLLDSAPLLPVADARIISRYADGNVLVIREGHCQRNQVVDALAQLHLAGGALLGTVFFSRKRGGGYYGSGGYGYGYGYGYGFPYGSSAESSTMDVREGSSG